MVLRLLVCWARGHEPREITRRDDDAGEDATCARCRRALTRYDTETRWHLAIATRYG